MPYSRHSISQNLDFQLLSWKMLKFTDFLNLLSRQWFSMLNNIIFILFSKIAVNPYTNIWLRCKCPSAWISNFVQILMHFTLRPFHAKMLNFRDFCILLIRLPQCIRLSYAHLVTMGHTYSWMAWSNVLAWNQTSLNLTSWWFEMMLSKCYWFLENPHKVHIMSTCWFEV